MTFSRSGLMPYFSTKLIINNKSMFFQSYPFFYHCLSCARARGWTAYRRCLRLTAGPHPGQVHHRATERQTSLKTQSRQSCQFAYCTCLVLWEKAAGPQGKHVKALNPQPSCSEATLLTTAPPSHSAVYEPLNPSFLKPHSSRRRNNWYGSMLTNPDYWWSSTVRPATCSKLKLWGQKLTKTSFRDAA